jgi:hypothetical protein
VTSLVIYTVMDVLRSLAQGVVRGELPERAS